MINISQEQLKSLTYDKIKAIVEFKPLQNNFSFHLVPKITITSYAFLEYNKNAFIPCYFYKQQLNRNTFVTTFTYEQTNVIKNGMICDIVNKIINYDSVDKFIKIENQYPLFIGYFYNKFSLYKQLHQKLRSYILDDRFEYKSYINDEFMTNYDQILEQILMN